MNISILKSEPLSLLASPSLCSRDAGCLASALHAGEHEKLLRDKQLVLFETRSNIPIKS